MLVAVGFDVSAALTSGICVGGGVASGDLFWVVVLSISPIAVGVGNWQAVRINAVMIVSTKIFEYFVFIGLSFNR